MGDGPSLFEACEKEEGGGIRERDIGKLGFGLLKDPQLDDGRRVYGSTIGVGYDVVSNLLS